MDTSKSVIKDYIKYEMDDKIFDEITDDFKDAIASVMQKYIETREDVMSSALDAAVTQIKNQVW